MQHKRFAVKGVWLALLVLGLAGWACPAFGGAAGAPQLTTSELMAKAKDKRATHPKDRVDAIRKLGSLTTAQEVRDQRVVEALLDVARDAQDDLFVRRQAMQALRDLQFNLFAVDGFARSRYTIPFVEIIKNPNEEELIRAEVSSVFAKTLDAGDLPARQAVNAMLEIAEDKRTSLMLRVSAIRACSDIGSADCIPSFGKILSQGELDPLVKEAVLRGIAVVLPKLGDAKVDISLPTLNKINELVFAKDTPAEIRAQGLIALARLKKLGVKGIDILAKLTKILKEEENVDVVVASVESIGILDEEGGLGALLNAYKDFYDKGNVTRPADVRIRTAIIKTLGDLLNAQIGKKGGPNAATVKQIAELLLKIVDAQAEENEVEGVVENAIFALRYLYPKLTAFQPFHQQVAEKLITRLQSKATGMKEQLIDALEIVTRMPFKDDVARWVKWYDQAYPQFKLKKPE
jgi:hypothetical protein